MEYLEIVADVASILTAVVAGGAAIYVTCDAHTKRQRLEQYLKSEKQQNPNKHTHSIIHLMAELGMSEAELLHASFKSRHVIHKTRKDNDTGLAAHLLFEYSDEPKVR